MLKLHGSAASHWSTTAKNQWSTRFTSNGWRRCFHHAGFLVCSNLLGSSHPLSFPVPRALSSLFAFPLSPSVFSLSLPLMASSFCPPALCPRDLHSLASSVRPGIHARLLPFFPNSRHWMWLRSCSVRPCALVLQCGHDDGHPHLQLICSCLGMQRIVYTPCYYIWTYWSQIYRNVIKEWFLGC